MTTTQRRQDARAAAGRRLALYIMLIVLTTPGWSSAATRTWRGTGADAKWSNPDNWVLNLVPVDGDDLEFPVTVGPAVTENDIPNLLVRSLAVTSTRTLTGSGIRLQAGIAVSANATLTLDLPIQLIGAQTWSVNEADAIGTATASLDLNGSALTLRCLGSGSTIALNGVISGTGELIKDGNGGASLGGSNTFAGPVRVNEGGFSGQASSFGIGDGTAANGITTAASTGLGIGPGLVANEALALSGTLATFDVSEWGGPIVLTGLGSMLASTMGDSLTISRGHLRHGQPGSECCRQRPTRSSEHEQLHRRDLDRISGLSRPWAADRRCA